MVCGSSVFSQAYLYCVVEFDMYGNLEQKTIFELCIHWMCLNDGSKINFEVVKTDILEEKLWLFEGNNKPLKSSCKSYQCIKLTLFSNPIPCSMVSLTCSCVIKFQILVA